jgi:hypothetical protein
MQTDVSKRGGTPHPSSNSNAARDLWDKNDDETAEDGTGVPTSKLGTLGYKGTNAGRGQIFPVVGRGGEAPALDGVALPGYGGSRANHSM